MTTWPADKVKRWPIERLIPYARNARTHNDEAGLVVRELLLRRRIIRRLTNVLS